MARFAKSTSILRFALLVATASVKSDPGGRTLLICPPGAGNLGDQALVEAFLENVPGQINLLVRSETDFRIPVEDRARVRVIALPALLYGRLPYNLVDAFRFARILHRSSSLSIVGADIMDGAYNFRASVNRSSIAEAAARRAVPTRILGFSWNESPQASAIRSLRRAAGRGARLFLRDPRSVERALSDGLVSVTAAADLVFSARTIDSGKASVWISRFDDKRPIALLNVSGLIGRTPGLVMDYVAVVEYLARDHNVFLIPHVVKKDSDDLAASHAVMKHLDPSLPVLLVTEQLSPRDVRGFCAAARTIVTGRMHLAVNGLLQGRVPIVLATQGKVEGLMELFDAPQMCVQPRTGMAHEIIMRLDEQGEIDASTRLPSVKELSLKNFEGFPGLHQASGIA